MESHSTKILLSSAGLNYVNCRLKLVSSAKYETKNCLFEDPILLFQHIQQLEAEEVHKVILLEVSPKHEKEG